MRASSQLFIAVRLLNTVEDFVAQLNIFFEAGRVQLYCHNESIVYIELGDSFPVSWLAKVMQGSVASRIRVATGPEQKVDAFRDALDNPELKTIFRGVVKKHLTELFASPIRKCELRASQVPASHTILTVSELLNDCASNFLRSFPMDELIPNDDITFRATADYVERSTRVKISLQDGYLLSRLDRPQSIKDILPTIPMEEASIRRNLVMLWAYGVVDSPYLNQFVPKIEKAQMSQGASAPVSISEKLPEELKQQIEMIEQTYVALSRKDYYSLLGVSPKADLAEIKSSYYKLARKFHPDRFYGLDDTVVKEKVDIIFSAVNVAYETLKNSKTRQQYDSSPLEEKRIQSTPVMSDSPGAARGEGAIKVAEDYFQRAQKAYSSRNYFEAVQYLRSATQILPDKPKYWRQLGVALSKNDQWRKEAEESFLKAVQLEPINPENHLFLAFLYKNSGLRLRAKKCFQAALEVDPKNDVAMLELNEMEVDESQQKKNSLLGGIFKKK